MDYSKLQSDYGSWRKRWSHMAKTNIVNTLPSKVKAYISFQTLFLNDMSIYIFDENSKLLMSESFNNNYSKDSTLFLPEKTFSTSLKPGSEKTILIRLRYSFPKKLAFTIQSKYKAVEEVSLPYLLRGIFLGVLLLLTFSYFIYAWINQKINYLSLSLYQFFMTFFTAKTFGIFSNNTDKWCMVEGYWNFLLTYPCVLSR